MKSCLPGFARSFDLPFLSSSSFLAAPPGEPACARLVPTLLPAACPAGQPTFHPRCRSPSPSPSSAESLRQKRRQNQLRPVTSVALGFQHGGVTPEPSSRPPVEHNPSGGTPGCTSLPPHPLRTLPVPPLLGCHRSPSQPGGHGPWGPGWPGASAQRRGCRGDTGTEPRWGPGSGSPHLRVPTPAAAPLLGLAGGKYCLCFSNICLLVCICRFFKDREPPLPRFLRRYPQQCRPRSPPHSKKTNVRPRIDMK